MAEEIEISYNNNPPGQIGERPRKFQPGDQVKFVSKDGNDLVVDFLGNSPLTGDNSTVKQNDVVELARKPGRYPFKCTMTVGGRPVTLPPSIGGEIEVGN